MSLVWSCLIFFVCLQYDGANAFLMNSSSTGLTSYEFSLLSQDIYEERMSRHQVENQVTTLEQRLSNLEHELTQTKQKHDQEKADLLRQVNVTTTRIKALEHDVNISQAALNAQTKKTEYLKQAFDKETANRHQIQLEYTDLKLDFQNLSSVCENLTKHVNDLQSSMASSKSELQQIQQSVNNLTTTILQQTQDKAHNAFSAYWINDTSLSTGETLVFSKTIFDNEDSYDNSTGNTQYQLEAYSYSRQNFVVL